MYGENRKKLKGKPGQFEAYNITSGTVVTFTCDGVSKDGDPNQARQAALRKLEARDADGDPLFVPVRPLPDYVIEQDNRADRGRIDDFRTLEDRSRSPDFDTLEDKWRANGKLRKDFMERMRQESAPANPALAPLVEADQAKAKAEADTKAAGTGPQRGKAKKSKAAETAPEAS